MGVVEKIAGFLDETSRSLSLLGGRSINNYVQIGTADRTGVIIGNDLSLVSLIRWNGSTKMVGKDEFNTIVNRMTLRLSSNFAKPGHVMHIVFTNEGPEAKGGSSLSAQFRGLHAAANRQKLEIDDVLDNREEVLADLCGYEYCYIAFWTKPTVFTSADWKKIEARVNAEGKGIPHSPRMQDLRPVAKELLDTHSSIVDQLVRDLDGQGISAEKLDSYEALRVIREHIDPDYTPQNWKPILPGDAAPRRMPEYGEGDVSDLLWPPLASQVVPREPIIRNFRYLQIGSRIWAPVIVKIPPQNPMPFSDLFSRLRASKIPWRVSITISGSGMAETNFNAMMASALTIVSGKNKVIKEAFDHMKARADRGEPIVALRMIACTWAKETDESLVSERASRLATAIQGWGNITVSEISGNPASAIFATVPGCTTASPAPPAAPHLKDALELLPWHRPASPWARGNVVFRTPDGKVFPFSSYSSQQDAWVSLVFAPMGGGKSVLMNSMNLGLILDETSDQLPLIRILDIGTSSSGLISLLKFALPPHLQHKAAYIALQNTTDYAWNPMDLPLGQDYPLGGHKEYLVSLFSLIATAPDSAVPYDGIEGIAAKAIDIAYRSCADTPSSKPKMYAKNVDFKADEAIEKHELKIAQGTSWYRLRDLFFELGDMKSAFLAQRYAVPTMSDLIQACRSDDIRSIYKGITPTNQTMPDYFNQKLIDAREAYPILAVPTRFDLGDASIVSIDLQYVAPKNNKRKTAIMYLVALGALSADFFIGDEILPEINPKYREYHERRIMELARAKKRLCADELHRPAEAAQMAVNAIETIIREGRKWQVDVLLASQRYEDFSDTMKDLCTNFFVLKPPSSGVAELARKFELTDTERFTIETALRGPEPGHGANVFARFETKKGRFSHLLTSSIGGIELWAFSTTKEDTEIRKALYKSYPARLVRKALAKRFPGGSAKSEIERRQGARSMSDMVKDEAVYDEIINETRKVLDIMQDGIART